MVHYIQIQTHHPYIIGNRASAFHCLGRGLSPHGSCVDWRFQRTCLSGPQSILNCISSKASELCKIHAWLIGWEAWQEDRVITKTICFLISITHRNCNISPIIMNLELMDLDQHRQIISGIRNSSNSFRYKSFKGLNHQLRNCKRIFCNNKIFKQQM